MNQKKIEEAMQAHLDNLTKPRGSLGKLEDYCKKLSVIQNKVPPVINKKCVFVFGGDHGIASESVSLYPAEVSFQMAMNMLTGGAAINALSEGTGWDVTIVDAGIAADFPPDDVLKSKNKFIRAKIMKGSRNFYKESAMTEDETEAAVEAGKEIAALAAGEKYDMVAIGDLGIGNTSTAAAMLIAAGLDADSVIDRGTGIDDKQLTHKKRVIKEAVVSRRPVQNAYSIMQELGAPDLAMMAGFILGLKEKKIACVLDGFPVTAAAYMACMIDPAVTDFLFAGHRSKVAGHAVALEKMNLEPILQLDMHLGEGSGAVLGGFIVCQAALCASKMASFTTAGVSDIDVEEEKY